MKIGLSTSVVQRGHSGVGQYVLALVRALLPAARGHEFTLFVLEEDLPLFNFARDAMRLQPVAERHRPAVKNILWHQWELPRLAQRAGIEVLHVPSYRRMLWRQPCGLVSTIHDLAPFHLAGKYDWARMFYGRVVARRLAHRQDEIIAVSQLTARDITTFFRISSDRITVIPNGLDHERFRPASPPEGARSPSQRRGIASPFFLYVARLEHPGKNHVRLIAAFDRFKAATGSNWQLVLGGSDWHGAPAIHERIGASPFAREIHCLGFLPPDDLADWYRAAGAFVFPSLFEGFGLPPIEAMACGCPVLASTRGALAETVGTAAAILDPENVGQIEAEMTRVAIDAAWRQRLISAGLQHAHQFNWNLAAAATLKIYDRARRHNFRRVPQSMGWGAPSQAGKHPLGRPEGYDYTGRTSNVS